MPEQGEKLSHPVPNMYIPDPKKLTNMMADRED